MKRQKTSTNEQGSIIVYILLGVALFAALGFAVSNMMRSTTSVGSETAGVHASEIISYAHTLRQALHVLRISNECADDEISFERASFDGSDPIYVNTSAPSDFSCHIFHPNGGGVSYQKIDDTWLDLSRSSQSLYGEYLFSGGHGIPTIGTHGDNTDTSMKELIVILPWIDAGLCRKMNEQLGHIETGQPIPQETGNIDMTPFTGAYGTWALVSEGSSIEGKTAGCFAGSTGIWDGSYYFYHLLIAR
ncbi:MAG: hypothetical protein ACRBCK_02140 [Alphaproteobacteria bacterium]